MTFDAGLERFLRLAPGDAFGFDVARLAAGETIVATEGSSYAPLDRLLAIRADAEYVRELAPDVERRSIEQLARRVDADETFSAEICLSAAVLAAAESVPEYADAQERIVAADAVDVVVTERAIDLAVCLADGTVALGVEDADGHPVAVCVCEDPVVYEWAEARFDRYVEAASALGP